MAPSNRQSNAENRKSINYRKEAEYLQAHSYRYILYGVLQKLTIDSSHTNFKSSQKTGRRENKDDLRGHFQTIFLKN